MISQKEAVYQATKAVLEQHGIELEDGQDVREAMGDDANDIRSEIRDLVFQALSNGQVALGDRSSNEEKRQDESTMRRYATGLVSNWFRKDKRLNGNQRYIPNDRGNNSNVTNIRDDDERISRLVAALEVADSEELQDKLEEAIEERRDELNLERKLAEEVKGGRYKDDFEDEVFPRRSQSSKQDTPPSMGSGHRGAVTDPRHDMRLKQNESPELHKARQEAGRKGGETVARERGSEFYSQIGQKGGQSRGTGQNAGSNRQAPKKEDTGVVRNLFRSMLDRRSKSA
jgi:general stress protein YciG